MTDLAEVAARLGRRLHAAGVPVTAQAMARFAAAVALATPARRSDLYWTARVTLVSDRDQLAAFDREFARVFAGLADPAGWRGQAPPPVPLRRRTAATPGPPAPPADPPSGDGPAAASAGADAEDGGGERTALLAAASADERLRHRDLGALDRTELAALRAAGIRLAAAIPLREGRRRRPARRGALDVRATLRAARRTGGLPVLARRRHPRPRGRRLVLLCDVSGSMEPYARAYLQLLAGGVTSAGAEAFVFATRLTRLTRALREGRPDAALERAGRAAPDWSGGTRLGEALRSFNDLHGRRGLARGAVVVILSDGWDRGDPALVGREAQRLRRLAHRVVWVNPRKAARGYAPLAGGMAAALPHVDAFVAGNTLAAIDEVVAAVAGAATPR